MTHTPSVKCGLARGQLHRLVRPRLAVVGVSHICLSVAVRLENHLSVGQRNNRKFDGRHATVSGKGKEKCFPLDLPASSAEVFPCVLMPFDALCAVGVIHSKLPRAEPAAEDSVWIDVRLVASDAGEPNRARSNKNGGSNDVAQPHASEEA